MDDIEDGSKTPASDTKLEQPAKGQTTTTPWANDQDNPLNWPGKKKWMVVTVVSAYTFVSALASSMIAPGLPDIAVHYKISNPTVVALCLSIFLLANALGPLVLAPMSEVYGRTWVLHVSNIVFLAFNVACAFAPSVGSLIAFRFLAGIGGSAAGAIGGGSVGDLFSARERASAMSLYAAGPVLAPIIAPVAGGFITASIGFKWIFIVLAIASAVTGLIALPLLEETFAPVIKARKAKARGEKIVVTNARQVFLVNLTRPLLLLSRSLICFVLSLYCALTYAYLYLLFTTFPTLFTGVYGWSTGVSGLAYLGPGLGFMVATLASAGIMNKTYAMLSAKHGGVGKPEYRIPTLLIGSVLVPIGLFWYGWSAEARIHWIMPILGGAIFGAGMMFSFMPIQVYLVDIFTIYAASATATTTLLRSLFAFAFPLFGQRLFDAVGVGAGNSILAGISIPFGVLFPLFLWFYGDKMRAKSAALVPVINRS